MQPPQVVSYRDVIEMPLMVWQMDDTKFFNENRAKIAPELSGQSQHLNFAKDVSSGRQSDTAMTAATATNNHLSYQERLSAERNYYITNLNTRGNPDLITPGGALKGNMYFRKDPNDIEKEEAELQIA